MSNPVFGVSDQSKIDSAEPSPPTECSEFFLLPPMVSSLTLRPKE